MQYLLTCTDFLGDERDIAHFELIGDAYEVYAYLKIIRPLHREMSLYWVQDGKRERLLHHDQRASNGSTAA